MPKIYGNVAHGCHENPTAVEIRPPMAAVAEMVLFYEYDFGDSWLHHIELIEVFESTDDPSALLLRGERRGPLEDSGASPALPNSWRFLPTSRGRNIVSRPIG